MAVLASAMPACISFPTSVSLCFCVEFHTDFYYASAPIRRSVWRLSVAYIGPNSRTERPRKTKIGTEVAHITHDSDTTFKVKGQLVADVLNSPHAGTEAIWWINTKILSTCRRRRHIVSPRAQLVNTVLLLCILGFCRVIIGWHYRGGSDQLLTVTGSMFRIGSWSTSVSFRCLTIMTFIIIIYITVA